MAHQIKSAASNGTKTEQGQFYWLRVVAFELGATFGFDGNAAQFTAYSGQPLFAPVDNPFKRVDLSGAITIEVGDGPSDLFPGGPAPYVAAPGFFGGSAALDASVNTSLVVAVNGKDWATAKITAGTNALTSTVDVSIDGGINFMTSGAGACLAKRVDAVAANPTVVAWAAQAISAQAYELPLPANATHVRVRIVGGSGNGQFTIQGGQAYVPGEVVTGVLFDFTSPPNTTNNTGILDLSGWARFDVFAVTQAAMVSSVFAVDDAGADLGGQALTTIPASSNTWLTYGPASIASTLAPAANTYQGGLPIYKRMRAQCGPIAALTSRIRCEVRRGNV